MLLERLKKASQEEPGDPIARLVALELCELISPGVISQVIQEVCPYLKWYCTTQITRHLRAAQIRIHHHYNLEFGMYLQAKFFMDLWSRRKGLLMP